MSSYNCIDCAWFEDRTSFCRVNPPIPLTVKDNEGRSCITSVYPVIKKAEIDWCSLFEAKND